jgi:alkaline phosphatase D
LIDESCKDLHARGRTMLGKPQEAWLTEGLQGVPDRWHLIAQQTLMARAAVMVDGHRRVSSDAWDGYPDARDRLLGTVADNGLRSCVVLSSDAHAVFVCDLKRDFADTQAPSSPRSSATPRSAPQVARRVAPTQSCWTRTSCMA